MGKVEYDFREGLDQEKIVYKKESFDCKSCFYYFLCLMVCWIYTAGWFALFHYAYINHEPIAFWVYIGCWLAFALSLLTIIIVNLSKHYHRKNLKKAELAREMERRRIFEEEEKRNREARQHKKHEHDGIELGTMTNNENIRLKNE
jgi:type VI protein secretion system component VasK